MTKTPEKLGKYQIVAVIGEGSMGVVYKAIDPDIQEYVALKAIHKKLLSGDDKSVILQRFINEVKAGRLLRHPNIVAMYDYQEDEDTCFLVMEYIEGVTLKDLIQANRFLDGQKILNIINQVLDGLQAAHKQGVVHRDIKPENLILKDDGDVRIADFGVARLDSSTMTTDGAILGSPSYMSPEQCLGKQVDARSDLFSVGVVLYQMLTGQKPFSGLAFMETMQQILHTHPTMPSAMIPALGTGWDKVISKALTKHADGRFQTAADFQNAMKEINANHTGKYSGKRLRWRHWLASACFLVTIIVGGYWWFTQSRNTSAINLDQVESGVQNEINSASTQQVAEAGLAVSSRQKLKQFLEQYACNNLLSTIDAQRNVLTVSGYISGTREQAFRLALSRFAKLNDLRLSLSLKTLINGNCEALSIVQPFVQQNNLQKHGLQIEAYRHSPVFIEGERPVFEVITPDFPGYLYVDYFMADGNVFHLVPADKQTQQEFLAQQNLLIGNYGKTRQWQIVGPYGTEIISVILSDRPLFASAREDIENSENYLLDLRLVLFESEDAVIVADNFIITTMSQVEANKKADL